MSEETARRRRDELKARFAEKRAKRLHAQKQTNALQYLEMEASVYVWGSPGRDARAFTDEELVAVAELILEDEEHMQSLAGPLREDVERALEVALGALPSA